MGLDAGGVHQVGHHEHRRGNTLLHQERERVVVKIAVAVIKGDGRDRVVSAIAPIEPRAQFIQGNESETAAEPIQMPFQHLPAHQHGGNGGGGAGREILHHPVVADHHRRAHRARERADNLVHACPAQSSRGSGFGPASNHANILDSTRRAIRRDARSSSTDRRQMRPTPPGGYNSNLLSSRRSRLQCDL